MNEIPDISDLGEAVRSGDTATAREILTRYPDLLKQDDGGNYLLRLAARRDNVKMVSLLVEFGVDINAPGNESKPEGVIDDAASSGAINVVQWLIDRGARVNQQVGGVTRCFPLTGAIIEGHLDVVKLLVERGGADINALWGGYTPLSYAIMYGQKEIEAYLRSKGALEPGQLAAPKPPAGPDPILEHLKKHLGQPRPLSLREVVPGDPPLTIYAVPMEGQLALVTSGMSARPMTVPEGGEAYRFAELVIYLPPNWPLSEKALKDPNHFWPIEWLRRIARYPHENHTWLGGPVAIFANEEPPRPLAPNTKLSCLLAITEESEFGALDLPDGRRVVFYTLHPLYTEERDLERKRGTEHLLRLFQKYDIDTVVDVRRPNVALAAGKRRRGPGRR